jgi:RHS repeat-associated protein
MMIRVRTKHIVSAFLATSALVSSPAFAQQDNDFFLIPPTRETVDQNGVDLATGEMAINSPSISIGSGASGLSFQTMLQQNGVLISWDNPYSYSINGTPGATMTVVAGERSVQFTYNSTTLVYDNKLGSGETLTGSGSTWTFTLRDGSIVQMDASAFNPTATHDSIAVANTITFPNKEKLTLNYKEITAYKAKLDDYISHVRVRTVQSSTGYVAKLEYADNTTYGAPWNRLAKVTLFNSTVDSCAPTADSCTFSQTWPSLTFTNDGAGNQTATDALSRTTTYRTGSTGLTAIRRPSSATDDTIVSYDANGKVSSVKVDGRTWAYSVTLSTLTTVNITNPDGTQRVVVTDPTINQMKSEQNERGFTTTYTYDILGRLTDVQYPENNKEHYVYDARGNVTEKRLVSKTAGTPADIVTSASYPASCTNALTCNKPTTTTDANSNVTNYTYDPTHGGLTIFKPPRASTGAVQPQTVYSYTQITSTSGDLVYMPTAVSQCQTQDAGTCTGTADETKTTTAYNGFLLPTSLSSSSGDGTLTATTGLTYDNVGNLTYVDGPLAGSADTTRTIYDLGRQVVGLIGPDPDGAGSLVNRAVRTSHDLDGRVTKIERGTTAGQSDSNWASFAPAEIIDIGYDASGREATRKLSASGTAYALTQYSYDANGRLGCAAVRMNPAAYGSLPASACMLGAQGSDGPDRIIQVTYDAAGNPIQIANGVGTGALAVERTLGHTNNGQVQSLTDAENNKTTYVYDGFDRLSQVQYPSATKGAGTSNASDYEQLTYDPASNVTSRRLRDGSSIGFTYDFRERLTLKDLPGAEYNVSYVYDNLNRPTSLVQKDGTGATIQSLTFTFDALSRNLTQTGPEGTICSTWDLAGRRTQLRYPGSSDCSLTGAFYVNYDYLVTGDVQKIREDGASSGVGILATYAYDNLGNVTSVTFGNGALQSYAYDPVSRLQSITHDLSGTTNDLTIGNMTYNAASAITSAPRSNNIYSWTGAVNVNRNYTSNGLNQYSAAGSASFTYDAKGNLTSDGTNSYCYSSENLLTGEGGACTTPTTALAYDPAMRLYQVAGSSTTRFAYDGLNLISDYDGTNMLQHRYVFGPGMDNPLVEYAGSGITNRTFLGADERGSIIARTDSSGAFIAANTYDEYGIPGSSNAGLFQYTGQAWLTQLGMYYYKARIYSPTLGRFLQTDPVGYGDGSNWHAYAHNDPVNGSDPFGLDADPWRTSQSAVCTGSRIPGACSGSGNGLAEGSSGGVIEGPSHGNPALGGGPRTAGNSSPSGYWYCTTCGPSQTNSNGDIIVTAPHYVWVSYTPVEALLRPTGEAPFYFNGERFAVDPLYRKPWYSNAVDYGVGCLAVCPLAVGGGFVAGSEAAFALGPSGSIFGDTAFGAVNQGVLNQGPIRFGFGRGLGFANFRIGYYESKLDIFRISIPR